MKILAILAIATWLGLCLYQKKIYLRGITITRAEQATSYWVLIAAFSTTLIVLIVLLRVINQT